MKMALNYTRAFLNIIRSNDHQQKLLNSSLQNFKSHKFAMLHPCHLNKFSL